VNRTREQRRRRREIAYRIFVAVLFLAVLALCVVAIRYGMYVSRLVKEYAESPYANVEVVTLPADFDEAAFDNACLRYELEKDAGLYVALRR